MGVGLEVIGESNEETSGLVLHAGTYQMETLDQLMKLVLAPTTTTLTNEHGVSSDSEQQEARGSEENTNQAFEEKKKSPSFFQFPLHSVSLLYMDSTKIFLPSMIMKYRADGTLAQIEAERLDLMPLSSGCSLVGDSRDSGKLATHHAIET
jgi:hypothetical protein